MNTQAIPASPLAEILSSGIQAAVGGLGLADTDSNRIQSSANNALESIKQGRENIPTKLECIVHSKKSLISERAQMVMMGISASVLFAGVIMVMATVTPVSLPIVGIVGLAMIGAVILSIYVGGGLSLISFVDKRETEQEALQRMINELKGVQENKMPVTYFLREQNSDFYAEKLSTENFNRKDLELLNSQFTFENTLTAKDSEKLRFSKSQTTRLVDLYSRYKDSNDTYKKDKDLQLKADIALYERALEAFPTHLAVTA